jgi:class 3 adenylate cyclase
MYLQKRKNLKNVLMPGVFYSMIIITKPDLHGAKPIFIMQPLRWLWSLLVKLYLHFDTLPHRVAIQNSRFYVVANVAQTGAWMAHLGWFFVLLYLDVEPLAWVQLFSVACYVAAIVFNRFAYHMVSMTISLSEIVLHQIVAVMFLGVDAGFQYFIPVVAIFPFLMPGGSVIWKTSLLLLCTAGFLYIQLFLVQISPLYAIGAEALGWFNVSNIILSFCFIGIWAYYLNIAITRAEIILARQTKELALAEQKAEQEKIKHELTLRERDNEIFRLRNIELKKSYDEILEQKQVIEEERNKSRRLLLNILPEETANELMNQGKATTRYYDSATVLFSDFVNFTGMAEKMKPEELVKEIDVYFQAFDQIIRRNNIEKIKTIGDAYMAVGGLPVANQSHATDVVKAAREMMEFANERLQQNPSAFHIRIGINTGPLIAGVVGNHKFQYDIWGDTVNVAARMEQNSESGQINISGNTFQLIGNQYNCLYRGKIEAKNKGRIEMYFVQ